MSLDQFGLYHPDLSHPAPPAPSSETDGDPEGVLVGWPGREVFDPTTRTFYWFEGEVGSTTGWIEKLTLPS